MRAGAPLRLPTRQPNTREGAPQLGDTRMFSVDESTA